jgi:hypothetical protein
MNLVLFPPKPALLDSSLITMAAIERLFRLSRRFFLLMISRDSSTFLALMLIILVGIIMTLHTIMTLHGGLSCCQATPISDKLSRYLGD